jgi:hypothetical protein
LFINKFFNRKDITNDELNYIQYTVYNKYNINDPLVINFFNVFSQICFEIINNDTIKNAFNLPENVPNYKDQKIVQAYNNTIYPYHTIINEFIYATVSGYATNIKKVIAYVFFTTATKNLTRTPTTPTGVRRKPIEGVKYCCIFYK